MRILLAVARCPFPPRRGDQLRALQLIESLRCDHLLTVLVPAGRAQLPELDGVSWIRYRRRWAGRAVAVLRAVFSGAPLQSGAFYSADLGRQIRRLAPDCEMAIFQLARLDGHLQDFGDTPLAVDLIDALSLSFERRAMRDLPLLRPFLRWEASRLLAAERRLLGRVRVAWVVCDRDRRHLAERLGAEATDRLRVLPLVCPQRPAGSLAAGDPDTVVMTGNFGYFPNREGARWFLETVWPRLLEARPQAQLVIAGARPASDLRRRAARAGVELIVSPADLGTVLARGRVAVAPLRSGAGVPVKILEAWSAGVPVVASPFAAAGAGATPGDDVLSAEAPDEWVAAIVRLFESEPLRRQLAQAGRARILRVHSAAAVKRCLADSLELSR